MRFPGWLLVSSVCAASSLRERPLWQRAHDADRVAFVQVLGQETVESPLSPGRLETRTSLAVAEDWKGQGPAFIELVQWGGRKGLWESRIAGDAVFRPAETAVVLLRCRDTSRPGRCRLLALAEGKFRIEGDRAFVFRLKTGTEEAVSVRALRQAMGLSPTAPNRPARRHRR